MFHGLAMKGARMKKNNLLLALLASSLILASCGDDKNNSGSGKENETSQQSGDSNGASGEPGLTSEPEISVDTRTNEQKVKDLFALMAEGKSSTIEYNGYTTEFYGETKGLWNEAPASSTGSQSSGLAVIPNYGIFTIAFDEDLDEFYLTGVATPNAQLKITDVQYTTIDLGKASKSITFTESSRTHTFTTNDATFCNAMLGILGGSSLASVYTSKKVAFNVNDDGTSLSNLSLELKDSSDATNYPNMTIEGIKISKIGKTTSLDLENLLANATVTARNAWTTYEEAYFEYLYTGFTLPFPNGASYAVNVDVLDDGEFYFEDLGCGNIVNSYKNQLTAAGFTLNEEESDTVKGLYCYEKSLADASGSSREIKEYVMFAWQNDSTTASLYPNGRFVLVAYPTQGSITVRNLKDLNLTLAAYTMDSTGQAWWPMMNIAGCTSCSLTDATASQTDYDLYLVGYLYFATEAEAIAAVSAINNELYNNNYTDAYLDDYGCMSLEIMDPSTYDIECVDIFAVVGYDSSGNYTGYVMLVIEKYYYSYY